MPLGKQFANTQDLVSIKEIRDNVVVLDDDSLKQIIMVSGINTALKSENELNLISASYQNFLNSLDYPIQTIVHSRKININHYLEDLDKIGQKESSALLQNQISEYRNFVSGFVKNNDIMEKTFLVVVPFSPTHLPGTESFGLSKFIPFISKKDKAPREEAIQKEKQELNFSEHLNQLSQRTIQVIDGLKSIGLEAVILGEEELIELFYNFYNPETVERDDLNIAQETNNSE